MSFAWVADCRRPRVVLASAIIKPSPELTAEAKTQIEASEKMSMTSDAGMGGKFIGDAPRLLFYYVVALSGSAQTLDSECGFARASKARKAVNVF